MGVDAGAVRDLAKGELGGVEFPRARPDVRHTPSLMLKWLEP